MPAKNAPPTAIEWMDAHPKEYALLFDGGALSRETFETRVSMVGPDNIALSALTRYNDTRRHLPQQQSDLIRRGVGRVLYATYEGNFGVENNFVQNLTPKQLNSLEHMTTKLIFAWQRSCMQYRRPSPFAPLYVNDKDIPLDSTEHQPIKLILMAAAALRSVSKCVPSFAENNHIAALVKKISVYGPFGTPPKLKPKPNPTPTHRIRSVERFYGIRQAPTYKDKKQSAPCPAISEQRRQQLINAAQNGMPPWQLAGLYGITEKAVRQIMMEDRK